MSWNASRTKRLFPLSSRGIALLAVAAGVLLIGAARMELAALVWGSSFVLLALYCLAGSHIARRLLERHLRDSLEPVGFRLPADGVFPGSPLSAEVESELPRLAPPGFEVCFRACLQWHERAPLRLSVLLPHGRQSRSLSFRAPPRGLYRSETVRLVLRDVLGFTRAELPVPLSEQLRVFPAVKAAELKTIPGGGGEELPHRLKRRASEELLEVRKYYPGDDLRRVHWKLFAHLQQLFLRTGEQTPPPESRFLAILDLSPSPWVPPAEAPELLDAMIEACASGVLALLGRGMQAWVAVTDRPRAVALSLEKADTLLGLASELWWSERLVLELPRSGRREVLLYSLPDSEHQGQLLRACAARNWEVRLFLKELPPRPALAAAPLRRLLFAHSGEAAPRRDGARSLELRRRYEQALRDTEERLRRTRSVHVERI
ncbi:MAG: DUF58 domain-containing protein [Spirochaetales bacterium]|nr:DUF58 domain-containing protein [Spirochaetales bacterium]